MENGSLMKAKSIAECSPYIYTVKPVLSGHLKNKQNKGFNGNGSLMKVESIAECSLWSIQQYFWTALSDNWSWKPILVFFMSGRLRQGLLYHENKNQQNNHAKFLGYYIF